MNNSDSDDMSFASFCQSRAFIPLVHDNKATQSQLGCAAIATAAIRCQQQAGVGIHIQQRVEIRLLGTKEHWEVLNMLKSKCSLGK